MFGKDSRAALFSPVRRGGRPPASAGPAGLPPVHVRLFLVVWSLLPVVPARAAVVGEIVQAGFRIREGIAYRSGCWLPVLIELRTDGRETFGGRLRLEQPDTDGDRCAVELPVTLTPGSETARRFWMYCPVNLSGDAEISVRLLNEAGTVEPVYTPDGGAVERLKPAYYPEEVDTEETFVLDVSAKAISKLASLESAGETKLIYPLRVAACPPRNIPDRWYGLEMVDIIVWDQPDLTDLTANQIEAVRQWVWRGGTLLVAAGKSAANLKATGFVDLLPADVSGSRRLEEVDQKLSSLIGANPAQRLRPRIIAANLSPKPGARVQYAQTMGEPPQAYALVVRGRFGFGHVTMIGVDLADLGRVGDVDYARLFGQLLLLRRHPRQGDDASFGFVQAQDLFPEVRSPVDFAGLSGLYVIVAFLFIVAYILGSTVAAWHYLQRRGWSHHNWSVFAIAAVAGSAVSVGAVQALRGVGSSVAQLTIVDAWAGSPEAQATCYFGLKTGTHASLDLWLPSDPARDDPEYASACKLKPIPPGRAWLPSSFSDPHRYEALPERARLTNVLMRATLKQFEGHWSGELSGRIDADIGVSRAREITNDSWIANDLGSDLYRCYLLVAHLDPGPLLREEQAIDVYDLQTIRAGQRITRLGDYLFRIGPKKAEGQLDFEAIKLKVRHDQWAARHRGIYRLGGEITRSGDADAVEDTLLLLTTMKDLTPESTYHRYGADLARSHGRRLDLTDGLTTDTAVLIGFTREAGPVRLCVRRAGGGGGFDAREPRTARTMYRFWIPLRRAYPDAQASDSPEQDL